MPWEGRHYNRHWGKPETHKDILPLKSLFHQTRNPKEMDWFLGIYSWPRLNQDEMNNLRRAISPSEKEAVIKFPNQERPARPNGFTAEFYWTFREELTPQSSDYFPK